MASGAALSGCAALVASAVASAVVATAASVAAEGAYSVAFRIKIEDLSALPEDVYRQVREVRLISAPADPMQVSKGEVKGLACQLSTTYLSSARRWWPVLSEANGLTPEEAAMMQLKLKAFRAGGNAVASWSCTHNSEVDWLNNCFETWVCKGDAVRLAED